MTYLNVGNIYIYNKINFQGKITKELEVEHKNKALAIVSLALGLEV
jgi:hypothetical protein